MLVVALTGVALASQYWSPVLKSAVVGGLRSALTKE
jgi:hypothetical protein